MENSEAVQTSRAYKWSLREVILMALIGIGFGVIYFIMDPIYAALDAVLVPMGLHPYAIAITIGPWMMAAPLASYLLKRVGAGLIGEILAATGEALLGGYWGVATIISGFIQGIGSELGFTLTGYKSWKLGLILSTLTGTAVTFFWSLFHDGYLQLNIGMLIGLFIVRWISVGFFAGVLVYWIVRLLEKSKLLK
ncbi:ECF transporter S component [Leuconostoc fallax]|uniref:Cobalt ABC transporter permease n=1 Tax=Leuconostoc fallax TaxID=1251 RepID=A0A4R5N8U9_9LACO|nr:ECF transporter S component [Leuconostoc fallax]MBU7455511.1 ECF transporter S component [Leuconostoc fallax]TDG68241.1 hypothetical protein C5L23_000547 [Leuconostoc fallax]